MTAAVPNQLEGEATLSDLRLGGLRLNTARFTASGSRAAHTLRLQAGGEALALEAELAGGWNPTREWVGHLRTLQNRGRFPFALLAPAPLRQSGGFITLLGSGTSPDGAEQAEPGKKAGGKTGDGTKHKVSGRVIARADNRTDDRVGDSSDNNPADRPGARTGNKASDRTAATRGYEIALTNAVLKFGEGNITLQSLEKSGPRLTTRGTLRGLALDDLAQLSPALARNVATDLRIGGDWSLSLDRANETVNGRLHLARESGDITVLADAASASSVPVQLGIGTLAARADIADNRLRVQIDLDGKRSGTARLEASTSIARQAGKWGLSQSSPLSLNAKADLPSLAALTMLAGQPGLDLEGKLALSLSGGGTLGAPQLTGTVNGDGLALRLPAEGFTLKNGQLRARLEGDRLLLQSLRFDGEEGKADADGWISFADTRLSAHATIRAERLRVLSRPDRLLVLGGDASVDLDSKRLTLRGKLVAERATFELAALDSPVQSDDVVVLGAPKKQERGPGALPFSLDLALDLGQRFQLKGLGLDARLGGTLQLHADAQRPPRAKGTVGVLEGSYNAYGQKLKIEQSTLTFNGPLDNPSLRILGLSKKVPEDADVQVGVELRGTAQAPVARLVSTPNMPDSEKLSWLVLGHGTGQESGQEYEMLGVAAGALFGQHKVVNALGLDEIGMSRAKGLETAVVTVGKRLSERAYLTLEQGAGAATSLAKLRYTLNPRVSVQVQAGVNSALDVMYTWRFD